MGNGDFNSALEITGQVRMIDVARAAGVSRPTVSYVLNGCKRGQTRVKPETAEKIRRIARQLNFHPNHAARQLAGKRSGRGRRAGRQFLCRVATSRALRG